MDAAEHGTKVMFLALLTSRNEKGQWWTWVTQFFITLHSSLTEIHVRDWWLNGYQRIFYLVMLQTSAKDHHNHQGMTWEKGGKQLGRIKDSAVLVLLTDTGHQRHKITWDRKINIFWAFALHQRAFPVRFVAFHPKACYLKVRVEKSWNSRKFHCSLRHLNLKIGPWQVVHSQLPLPAAKVPQHLGVQDGQRKRNPHNSRNSCVFEMPCFHCEITGSHFEIKCNICDASVTSAAWLLASSLGILRKVFTSLQISSVQQHPLSLVYLIMTSDAARSLKKTKNYRKRSKSDCFISKAFSIIQIMS